MIMPEWLDSGIAAIIGVASGWMVGSITKANKSELQKLSEQFDKRCQQLESDAKQHVTRSEFRETLADLRGELARQQVAIASDLQQIHAALLQLQR